MRQQSGERWNDMEDMDDDEDDHYDEGEDGKEDVVADEPESQMPSVRETIVIDVSLSHFSCLEEY